jgi:mono/diheme cytochrome c family protein
VGVRALAVKRARKLAGWVLAVAAVIAAHQFVAAHAAAPADRAAQIEEGRALYLEHCEQCHGYNMVTPGTVVFDLRQFPHDQKPRFVDSVTNGKNGRMPAWGDVLTPAEIDEIWAYVLTGGKS